jgi:hypothetical protein
MRRREGRRIINTISRHGDQPPLGHQLLHSIEFVLRKQLRFNRGDSDGTTDRFGGVSAIASQHQLIADAHPLELADSFSGAVANAISQQNRSSERLAVGYEHGSRASPIRLLNQRFGIVNPMLAEKGCAAGADNAAADDAFSPAAGLDVSTFHLGQRQPAASRLFGYDSREGVLGPALSGCRECNEIVFGAADGQDAQDFEMSTRHRAGFVEHERIDFRRLLKGDSTSYENASTGQAAYCRNHCRRCCKDEGARASHD